MTRDEAYVICVALSVIDQGTTSNVLWQTRGKPSPQALIAQLTYEHGIDVCSDRFTDDVSDAICSVLDEVEEGEL